MNANITGVYYTWLNKKKMEIRLIVSMECPRCGGEAHKEWTGPVVGKGDAPYPALGEFATCDDCEKRSRLTTGRRSTYVWMKMAREYCQKAWREQKHVYHTYSSSKNGKTREKPPNAFTINDMKQKRYNRIVKEAG